MVGVNEYYTSKKCPVCQDFVGQVEIRRLYCSKCKAYMHRDIMAGHNMCNVIRGHLRSQVRPLYLQPVDKDGKYPWMEGTTNSTDSGTTTGNSITGSTSSSSSSSSSSSNAMQQEHDQGRASRRKRKAPDASPQLTPMDPSGRRKKPRS